MKNNKFLIALMLFLAFLPAMDFASQYKRPRSGSYTTPYHEGVAPTYSQGLQPIYLDPHRPQAQPTYAVQSAPAAATSSSWTPKFITDFWQGAKQKAADVAYYVPGYERLVKAGYLSKIQDWSASRLIITMGMVLSGLVKAGYSYEAIFKLFFDLAGKIWDRATIANAVKLGLATLGFSAVITDLSGK